MVDPNTLGIIAAMSVATVSGPAAPITAPIAYGLGLLGGLVFLTLVFLPGGQPCRANGSAWARRF